MCACFKHLNLPVAILLISSSNKFLTGLTNLIKAYFAYVDIYIFLGDTDLGEEEDDVDEEEDDEEEEEEDIEDNLEENQLDETGECKLCIPIFLIVYHVFVKYSYYCLQKCFC